MSIAAPPPSLIDGRAERALLGVLVREPQRFTDRRITRALFALEGHRFAALAAAAARGELAGDPGTATEALVAGGLAAGAGLFVVEALLEAEELIPEPLIGHLLRLAKRRTTRRLADSLRDVAERPTVPSDDREALATLSEQVAALASPEQAPWTRLATVQTERVAWLWDRRIPFGKLTLLDGDPGVGKTALTCDLAARVSRGLPLADEGAPWPAAGVVLVNAEDGLGDTLRPRLEAAGADLDRVVAFGVDQLMTLPDDLPVLRDAIQMTTAALVIIDPLMAVLHPSIDSHRDQDVRRVLAQLAKVADETGAAVVIVRHLTKTTGGRALYRGGGSIGIAGAARSVLLVAPDPEDKDRRVLVGVKHNLSAAPPALAFTLDSRGDSVAVAWQGRTAIEADALVATDSASIGEAVHVLEQLLRDGAVGAKVAEQQRRQLAISDYAWKEARRRLGVVAEKEAFSGGWVLRLPPERWNGGH